MKLNKNALLKAIITNAIIYTFSILIAIGVTTNHKWLIVFVFVIASTAALYYLFNEFSKNNDE